MTTSLNSRRRFLGRLGTLVGALATVPLFGGTARAGRSRFRGYYGGYGYGGYGYGGYGYRRSGFRGFRGYPGGFYGGPAYRSFGYPAPAYGVPGYGYPGGGFYNRGYGPGFYGGPAYGPPGIFLRLEGPRRRSVSQTLALLEA